MENEEDLNLELDIEDEEAPEETQEKPKETIEAKKARLERQLSQINKKLGNEPDKKEVKTENKEGLDRIDRMIARQEGIKSPEELSLLQDFMKDTGRDVESVLESRAFKAELKALREDTATEEALPRGTKRSSNSPRSNVDYWLAKGELPPASEVQLRRDVVNARMKAIESKSQFSETPIV